jgi:eukaryotic-like serine/threonine-protein kinase
MLTGQKIGPFLIEKELGSGAMGTVYRATHQKSGQKVAVKFMSPSLGGNERSLARFEREITILKQLNHPNIVRCFGASKYNGTPYYAMEYVEGESLDKVMERRGRITWEELVALGQQFCAGLYYAHMKGIIHRDLKPSNLMVLPGDKVKLTDFGIAKDLDVTQLTSANCTVGTAAYMSPEQCRGERDLTFKSDLYSMGVMFYELLTGRKPFNAENAMDMFLQHCNAEVERPSRMVLDIPVWLDTLVCQLLEKKSEHRPRDAEMVSEVLGSIAEKVKAQQSAGVDAARKRMADRLHGEARPDEGDKAAARLLLAGKFKVKRRKKVKPLHQRKWFQVVGISGLLLVAIGLLVWGVMPPSAEKLYARTERLMAGTPDEHDEALEKPITQYRRLYPDDPNEARKNQMQAWSDQVESEQRERQLEKKAKLVAGGGSTLKLNEGERLAHQAIRFANLDTASKTHAYLAVERWLSVLKQTNTPHLGDEEDDWRRLALLARKKISESGVGAEEIEQLSEDPRSLIGERLDDLVKAKENDKLNEIAKVYDDRDRDLKKLVEEAIKKIETPDGSAKD